MASAPRFLTRDPATVAFRDIARGTGGDVAKTSEALERARSDPAAFSATPDATALARLRELSLKISDRRR